MNISQNLSQNELFKASSPYLRQHAENPVWWQEWRDEVWEHAARTDKLVFLSIGYATCHWCHVMEKDSFEKDDIAEILNRDFVCIKVDREERPEIDSFYMSIVQSLTGRGGWPTSVILTPAGDTIWAGTFLEKNQFSNLANKLASLWHTQKPQILEEVKSLQDWLKKNHDTPKPRKSISSENRLLKVDLKKINQLFINQKKTTFDQDSGGFGDAPKFPQAPCLQLLEFFAQTDSDCRIMLEKTLECMAFGTLFDHVGGGFHRYATDSAWLVPHFEKMLYDNVLLAPLYAKKSREDKRSLIVFEETLNYLYSDLQSECGGFYCAEDADSDGIEGGFYLYTTKEVEGSFSSDLSDKIKFAANMKPEGNFTIDERIHALEKQAGYKSLKSPNVIYGDSLKISELKTIRDKRPRPIRDEKILASWNGMALQSLAQSYKYLGRKQELAAALKLKVFFEKNFFNDDGSIKHVAGNLSLIPGLLEDFCWTIGGFLELHDITLDSEILAKALSLQQIQDQTFWSEEDAHYRLSAKKDSRLKFETYDVYDNAMSSNLSQILLNLLKLYSLTGNQTHYSKYNLLLEGVATQLEKHPAGMSSILKVLNLEESLNIVHIYMSNTDAAAQLAKQIYQNTSYPLSIFIKYHHSKKLNFEICSLTACHFKTSSPEVFLEYFKTNF